MFKTSTYDTVGKTALISGTLCYKPGAILKAGRGYVSEQIAAARLPVLISFTRTTFSLRIEMHLHTAVTHVSVLRGWGVRSWKKRVIDMCVMLIIFLAMIFYKAEAAIASCTIDKMRDVNCRYISTVRQSLKKPR